MRNKPYLHAINHLQQSFKLNPEQTKYFNDLENLDITSCCHTLDGGFDPESGSHHPEERAVNYKLRVTCRQYKGSPEETTLYLVPVEGTINTTF